MAAAEVLSLVRVTVQPSPQAAALDAVTASFAF
jgi:hypothetical protein